MKQSRIIAVNSNCYHGYCIEDAIKGISDVGFHYIELTATKGWTEHVFPSQSFETLLRIRRLLEKKDLYPFAMSGHCNLLDHDRIKDFVNNIELAHFFGSKYIVSSIGEAHILNQETDEDLLYQNMDILMPYLMKYDMNLELEVHGEYGSGASINRIIKKIDSDRVRINYDTANAVFYGNVDVIKDMEQCIENIGYIHIKDKAGKCNEWNFPPLGRGDIDFVQIFNLLNRSNNNCPLSVEIEFTEKGPKSLDEVNEAVGVSYEYLKSNGFKNI